MTIHDIPTIEAEAIAVATPIETPPGRPSMTRRRFAVGATGTLGAIAVGATLVSFFVGDDGGSEIGFFDIAHRNDVYVTMTNGEEFRVTVKEVGTGRVIEEHVGVTGRTLGNLRSEHIRILQVR